jgi:uncharacterized protein YprB with RNaseH-like and TPR domain
MTNLSDRLKSLGVKVGAEKSQPEQRAKYPIENVVEGEFRETHSGETFVVEVVYSLDHRHGQIELNQAGSLELVAAWAGDPRIASTNSEGFAFLDTETTGLAGGSGTYAFQVGVGRFEEKGFRLAQFFMRDPIEEPAMLTALESFLAPCETVVTFNGKAFDLPLLNARYITNGWPFPLKEAAHLDLLHLARRLWRERLPSRALGYLEEHILGQTRTEEDTPGWMIPELYFEYLRSGDARPLKGVFYHNAMDVLSMVALSNHITHLLADPLDGRVHHALDLVAIGKLHQDLGYLDQAARIFEHSLEHNLPDEVRGYTSKRLSLLQKRRGESDLAISLWWQAAAEREIYAHEELAKYYEHKERDFSEAKRWTEAALAILKMPDTPRYERVRWEDDLKYRLKRLEGKIARYSDKEKDK